MTASFLIPLSWTLWSVLLTGVAAVGVTIFTNRGNSPEASRQAGVAVLSAILAMMALVAGVIFWTIKSQSFSGLLILTIALGYTTFAMIASPLVIAFEQVRNRTANARTAHDKNGSTAHAQLCESIESVVVHAR